MNWKLYVINFSSNIFLNLQNPTWSVIFHNQPSEIKRFSLYSFFFKQFDVPKTLNLTIFLQFYFHVKVDKLCHFHVWQPLQILIDNSGVIFWKHSTPNEILLKIPCRIIEIKFEFKFSWHFFKILMTNITHWLGHKRCRRFLAQQQFLIINSCE